MQTHALGILSALLTAATLHATPYVTQPESKIRIDGNCTVHSWQMTGDLTGSLEVGDGFPTTPTAEVKVGKIQAQATFKSPVISLKSDRFTEQAARYVLKPTDAWTDVLYFLEELESHSNAKTDTGAYEFDARGKMVAAGATNQVSMVVQVTPLPDGKIVVKGSAPLRLSMFNLKSPSLKVKDSPLIVASEDEIKLSFECVMAREIPKPK